MALADFYERSALAAAQVLEGFDRQGFLKKLSATRVGIAFDEKATGPQGDALLDLSVRLLSRLYPSLAIVGPNSRAQQLSELARRINPAIEIGSEAEIGIAVGGAKRPFATTIHAGSAGWDALIDAERPRPSGEANNPFGAGAAACFAAAGVFRAIFGLGSLDSELRFSVLTQDRVIEPPRASRRRWALEDEAVLFGVGAIGNAALWALRRAPLQGRLHIVDHETLDLGNLQRYVLCERGEVGEAKVRIPARGPSGELELVPHEATLERFLECEGYDWQQFLLALDSAADRRAAQAALPAWIANAWTQPGDLGCSTHQHFGGEGACVACMYLPEGSVPNEDELVTQAFGVPQLQMDVRTLLHTGAPVQRGLLEAIAAARGLQIESLLSFEGRGIRDLYVEGFCGGAVVPLDGDGSDLRRMHVPLAHQSALAGILLGATLVRRAIGADPPATRKTQIDLLAPLGSYLSQPLLARGDGRCICEDLDFRAAFELKYEAC